MRAARAAAALPWATLAGMSLGPCAAPARKTPSVGESTGRSLGWYSIKKPPGLRDRVSVGAKLLGIRARDRRGREHDHVGLQLDTCAQGQVFDLDEEVVRVAGPR